MSIEAFNKLSFSETIREPESLQEQRSEIFRRAASIADIMGDNRVEYLAADKNNYARMVPFKEAEWELHGLSEMVVLQQQWVEGKSPAVEYHLAIGEPDVIDEKNPDIEYILNAKGTISVLEPEDKTVRSLKEYCRDTNQTVAAQQDEILGYLDAATESVKYRIRSVDQDYFNDGFAKIIVGHAVYDALQRPNDAAVDIISRIQKKPNVVEDITGRRRALMRPHLWRLTNNAVIVAAAVVENDV